MPADQRAHAAVANAIVEGALPPLTGLACAYCTGTARVYHHHQGYHPAHWLDVVPLCRRCHARSHGIGRWRERTPPVAEERRVVPITIRFKAQLVKEIRALAEEENRSINGTVVEAVERYVRTRRRGQSRDATDGR
jgi:hypothetical protein